MRIADLAGLALVAVALTACGGAAGGPSPSEVATTGGTSSTPSGPPGPPSASASPTPQPPSASEAGGPSPRAAPDWLIPTRGRDAGLEHPPVLVADGSVVRRLGPGGSETVAEVDGIVTKAVGAGGGTVVAAVAPAADAPAERLVSLPAGTDLPAGEATEVYLYDLAVVDGEPSVLYGRFEGDDNSERSGDVFLQPLGAAPPRMLAPGFGPEFFTYAGSVAAGVVVTSSYADLTESFDFVTTSGEPVDDWYDPTADLEYNAPPLLVDAVLAPDAARMAYLSGPDWDGVEQRVEGRWELVVVARDGTEELRVPLAGIGSELAALDYDGRWAVVSWLDADRRPGPALLIDTAAPEPTGWILDHAGLATFDA